MAYLTSLFPDFRHHGRPADWVAAILLLTAALAACRPYVVAGQRIGWRRWMGCALCGLAIASVVYIVPDRASALGDVIVNARLLLVASLGLLTWALWWRRGPLQTACGLVLVLLGTASLLPLGLFSVYLLSQIAALMFYLLATAPEAEGRA